MSFFPQRLRSKSICSPLECSKSSSLSCPNLLDLDDELASGDTDLPERNTALTPGPEMMSSLVSSPKGNKSKKLHKTLFLLPTKFRRAKERRAQTQALKLPVFPLMDPLSEDTPTPTEELSQCTLEPPLNVRPKHTRPNGLGLGLGLFGHNLASPTNKMRRGSDSCILSPSSERHESETVADNEQICQRSCNDIKSLARRRNTLAPPSSTPPIFIVVSRSVDKKSGGLNPDALKRFLGKSLEQV